MADESGRELRAEFEALQGRIKQLKVELAVEQTPGFLEELEALEAEAQHAVTEARAAEVEASGAAERLAIVTRDVEEGERQLLAPRTTRSVGPATGAVTVATLAGSLWLMAHLLQLGEHPGFFGVALGVVAAMIPPPLLALLWRRRLWVSGTSRTLS